MYFAGVISTVIFIPWLADKKGRKLNVIINFVIFILATIALLFASDIITLYVLLFICGATFGGRVVVAMNFLLEFQQRSKKELVVFIKLLAGSIILLLITFLF